MDTNLQTSNSSQILLSLHEQVPCGAHQDSLFLQKSGPVAPVCLSETSNSNSVTMATGPHSESAQSSLTELQTNVHGEGARPWTAAECARNVEGGKLCKGTYISPSLGKTLQERETVITVSDALEFKGPRGSSECVQQTFTSPEQTQTFLENIDMSSSLEGVFDRASSVRMDGPDHAYAAVIMFERIPLKCLDLSRENLSLTPAAVEELQSIEAKLEKRGYQGQGLFSGYFERFGSHANEGIVELGGIIVATATCRGSQNQTPADVLKHLSDTARTALTNTTSSDWQETPGAQPSSSQFSEQSTTVQLVGGPPGERNLQAWKELLHKDPSFWRVIQRNYLLPIWELLENHRESFQNVSALKKAIEQEWMTMQMGDEAVNALRSDLKIWKDKYQPVSCLNHVECISSLEKMKTEHACLDEVWIKEVLYDATVQDNIRQATEFMCQSQNTLIRDRVKSAVRRIVLFDCIPTHRFPGISDIRNAVKLDMAQEGKQPLEVREVGDLPGVLKEKLSEMRSDGDDIKVLVKRLELRLREMQKNRRKSLEEVLLFCILPKFGFSLKENIFAYHLLREDIWKLANDLEHHLPRLRKTGRALEKQLYLLNMPTDVPTTQYAVENLAGSADPKIRQAWEQARGDDDTAFLRDFRRQLYQGNTQDLEFLAGQLDLMFAAKNVDLPLSSTNRTRTQSVSDVSPDMKNLLDTLGLTKYFPQKMSYQDVITLSSDMLQGETDKQKRQMSDIPLQFIRRIISLDSDTRNTIPLRADESTEKKVQSGRKEQSKPRSKAVQYLRQRKAQQEDLESTQSAVHPLDLIYLILLCADDFLRQELLDKLARNQYAVPFYIPGPALKPPETKSWWGLRQIFKLYNTTPTAPGTALSWGLKAICRVYKDKGELQHKTMVDAEMPLVSCLSLGEETSWKSRLVNQMVNPEHDTFWHHGLKGGNVQQKVSRGMAEVAWFLPSGKPEDRFPRAVAFTNARGSALDSPEVSNHLINSSTVVCIFTERVSDDLVAFLQQHESNQHKMLLVVHPKPEEFDDVSSTLTKLPEDMAIIVNPAVDSKFDTTFEDWSACLKMMLDESDTTSLTEVLRDMATDESIESDEAQGETGRKAAEAILQQIDTLQKKGTAKEKVLPCSSDLGTRQSIAELDKELCRQKHMSETETPTQHREATQEKKWKLQLKQLQTPLPQPFLDFLSYLFALDSQNRMYFLQALKLGLNEKSVTILQPIREMYEKKRSKPREKGDRAAMQKAFSDLSRQLTHASFGIEHFFREIAVWYENLNALNQRIGKNKLRQTLDRLSQMVASVLIDGTALEVFDGDSMQVPEVWIKAVLQDVDRKSPMKVCKVSALGAQSSGKSTLLNTMFGLNFPVSAGRCTRGAYMQLIKIDNQLYNQLGCNSLLVIDSEGLLSSELEDSSTHDNELATFVIGLSDLTLVIFKQEGNEMQSVLPIAIYAFMRMNKVGEKQACHFVRQNMGAVEAPTANQMAVDMFVQKLDEETLAAAEHCRLEERYTRFADVLQYEPNTDNTYAPGLWNGTPPMAKPNKGYSLVTQQLKRTILKHLEKVTQQGKQCTTLTDFSTWLGDIWDGIKYENFIFNFRNVLAIKAYRDLIRIFDEAKWKLKTEVNTLIHEKSRKVRNKRFRTRDDLHREIETQKRTIQDKIAFQTENLKELFVHFFQCTEYKCVNEDRHKKIDLSQHIKVRNKHLITDNEKSFLDDVERLGKDLEAELDNTFKDLKRDKLAEIKITDLDRSMETRILERVKEEVRRLEGVQLNYDVKVDIFNELWRDETSVVLRQIEDMREPVLIAPAIHKIIIELLKTTKEQNLFRKKETKGTVGKRGRHFELKKEHAKLTSGGFTLLNLWSQKTVDTTELQKKTDAILEAARKWYKWEENGEAFTLESAEGLFKEVIESINGMYGKKDFTVTDEYKVDLIRHIKAEAIAGFTERQNRYEICRSPEAILNEKKKHYLRRFLMELDQGNIAVSFSNTVLRDLILDNLNDVSETCRKEELLTDLVNNRRRFRNAQTLQASVLIDLYRKKNFQDFMSFIHRYNSYMRDAMMQESVTHFEQDKRLVLTATRRLEKLIGIITDSMAKTASSPVGNTDFISTFFSNMEGLRIPLTQAYEGIVVSNKEQFASIVKEQLSGPLKNTTEMIVRRWNIREQLQNRGMRDYLFSQLIGCGESCPFCRAPCDIHREKSSGDHMTSFHRPEGLKGRYWSEDCDLKIRNKLATEDCTYSVSSNDRFKHDGKWIDYKKYQEVFPKWSIQPNPDPDVEKYWKWFFATYNQQLASYYGGETLPADIPDSWHNITQEEVLKDVETKYKVKVNRSTLDID